MKKKILLIYFYTILQHAISEGSCAPVSKRVIFEILSIPSLKLQSNLSSVTYHRKTFFYSHLIEKSFLKYS